MLPIWTPSNLWQGQSLKELNPFLYQKCNLTWCKGWKGLLSNSTNQTLHLTQCHTSLILKQPLLQNRFLHFGVGIDYANLKYSFLEILYGNWKLYWFCMDIILSFSHWTSRIYFLCCTKYITLLDGYIFLNLKEMFMTKIYKGSLIHSILIKKLEKWWGFFIKKIL
jgi:hypothetical protein